MIEIYPTVVPNSFDDIIRVAEQYAPFAKSIHVDVADGKFAPNTTWMPGAGDMLPDGIEWEIHMMVENPHAVGLMYLEAGASSLIGHVEAFKDAENAEEAFSEWKKQGAAAVSSAALLQTSLSEVAPYVLLSDWILLMSISSIGVQGIPFEESSISRISEFHTTHPEIVIGVDGGVSEKNIAPLAEAGALHFCVGSAISKATDPGAMYEHLLSLARGL